MHPWLWQWRRLGLEGFALPMAASKHGQRRAWSPPCLGAAGATRHWQTARCALDGTTRFANVGLQLYLLVRAESDGESGTTQPAGPTPPRRNRYRIRSAHVLGGGLGAWQDSIEPPAPHLAPDPIARPLQPLIDPAPLLALFALCPTSSANARTSIRTFSFKMSEILQTLVARATGTSCRGWLVVAHCAFCGPRGAQAGGRTARSDEREAPSSPARRGGGRPTIGAGRLW